MADCGLRGMRMNGMRILAVKPESKLGEIRAGERVVLTKIVARGRSWLR